MIRSNKRRARVLGVMAAAVTWATFGACATGARTAQAQTSDDSTVDLARKLYVEGKELRDAGDLARSLEKLEAAHALYATPITALEVGRGRALVGKLRGAIDALESIVHLPARANESAKAANARAEADALLVQYRARLPRLVLHADAPDVRVRVDGAVVPTEALGRPYGVDPGTHHVDAARGDATIARDVAVAEGESHDVPLTFGAEGATPVALPRSSSSSPVPGGATTSTIAPRDAGDAPARGPNVVAVAAFGVGAVGVVVGAITGIVTLARAPSIRSTCVDGVCPSSAGLDSAQTLGTISTVSFVVGGVGAGVGLTALLVGSARHEPRIGLHKDAGSASVGAWVSPWIAGSVVGVRGGF